MTVSSIYKILDNLEMMVLKGLPIPMTPWVVVHHERVIDVLDKVRASVPGEIQEAHSVLKKREEIFIDAQNKAGQIVREAQEKADAMLNESEILKAVQAEAERIRQEVIADCDNMKRQAKEEAETVRSQAINESITVREGADRYADSVLANLDRDLTEMHSIVRNGQRQLAKIKSDSISNMTVQRQNQSYEQQYAQGIQEESNIR